MRKKLQNKQGKQDEKGRVPTRKLASIDYVLGYENRDVVATFRRYYSIGRREAARLWQDMLRFLWLGEAAARQGYTGGIPMYPWQVLMDEMWHCFILHSEDYAAFCQRYFGTFLHHRPSSRKVVRTRDVDATRIQATIDGTIELAYDLLGARVAKRWFMHYPRRYSHEFVQSRRVPIAEAYDAGVTRAAR
ncbi:MAG: hypothetical protein U0174_24690 [Polyangiaceae bacterium]